MIRAVLLALCLIAHAAPVGADEAEDAFVLQIDLGRRAIFMDRALEGAGITIPFVLGVSPEEDPQSPAALWRALREVGREGAIVQAIYCARRLVPAAVCRRTAPAWIGADPEPVPTLAQIRAHLDELDGFLEPYVDKGCAMGRKRSGDALFCSVE